jgi:hypothetical protein
LIPGLDLNQFNFSFCVGFVCFISFFPSHRLGKKGEFVKLEDTIRAFRDIVNGKYDHLPEQAFYMVGDIETVKAKAEQIALEVAKSKAMRGTRRCFIAF